MNPLGVEDDAGVRVSSTDRCDDVLAAPDRFAGAFHVQCCVCIGAWVAELARVLVDDLVTRSGAEQWGDDLAVGVHDPIQGRMGP